MDKKITVTVNGKRINARAGQTLSEIIRGEKPCGGHGRCGKCRVTARGEISLPGEAEMRLLSAGELAAGVRLACLTHALGDCRVETVSDAEGIRIVTEGALPEMQWEPSFSNCGAAIDIGTTTLAARLYDTQGNLLSEASRLNPQLEYGADVISRIGAALTGKAEALSGLIRDAVNSLLSDLAAAPGANGIDSVVITGNTVMLSLLVGESVEPFSHAPFQARRLFGETLTAEALSLSALPPETAVYLPPCISAFVGADTTCALLATGLCGQDTALLADIGTNGEMALWHRGELTVCATAAGPAFEGVGISMGMRAAAGAIDRVTEEAGKLKAHVIGDGKPEGICGSGLVDAIGCLVETEAIDETGYLEEDPTVIAQPVVLTQKDIRMFQLAKSAVCAGLCTLMHHAKLSPADISAVYIAGGFGNYLSKESAAKVGLLPKGIAEASRIVGNAALGGAAMLLSTGMKTAAESIAHNARVLDLSTDPVFSECYITGMMFGEI